MPPVLDQMNLVVRDVAASRDFYRLLGVDIPLTGRSEATMAASKVELALDEESLAELYDAGWRQHPRPATRVLLGFSVDSEEEVDATFQRLTDAGHHGRQPPYDAFWGARYAIVEDPDGNPIGLMSPVDSSRRSEGWPPPPSPAP